VAVDPDSAVPAAEAEAEEQAFLDRAYAGLAAMRGEASAMLDSVLDLGRGGTFQSRTERDIVVRTSLARLAQLDIGDEALCFGRIDRVTDPGRAGEESSWETFHIGRIAVSDLEHQPLVVDWRAPVAEPFYRATGLDPRGLARRRHLAVRRREVVGVEDEYFGALGGPPPAAGVDDSSREPGAGDADAGLESGLVLGGPGALLAALGRARSGRMGDIVATIQREQDEIIRAPLAGLLVVQGGPGTGKTAVALHRAAYLLYTHRFPLERQGVLVVGPNPLFLRYIEQVLPSLGESGVTLSTVTGLVADVRPTSTESEQLQRLKGDARMAAFVARALRTRQRPVRRTVRIPFGASVLRLDPAAAGAIVGAARRRRGTHNARRRVVEQLVAEHLAEQVRRVRATVAPDPGPGGRGRQETAADGVDTAELRRQLLAVPEMVEVLDRMWPRLSAQELLHDLFGARPLLAAAGRGLLEDGEIDALYRARSGSLAEIPWTPADVALLDEAHALLGPRRVRRTVRRPGSGAADPAIIGSISAALAPPGAAVGSDRGTELDEGARAYGHIVVDEVQDLSPMQLRMVARRSISGSMTVVGDIAQATGASSPSSWTEILHHLGASRQVRTVELTVSYRTPAEVLEVASRVLQRAAPGLTPPVPVRHSGDVPRVERVEPDALLSRAAEITAEMTAAVGDGRTAVLAPDALLADLHRVLGARGLAPADPREPTGPGLGAAVVLLPAASAHGLEFDAVVVVEPAGIAGGAPSAAGGQGPITVRGLRALYVALTRPTRLLAVVHAADLPVPFHQP